MDLGCLGGIGKSEVVPAAEGSRAALSYPKPHKKTVNFRGLAGPINPKREQGPSL
jgi:hypothetical protein